MINYMNEYKIIWSSSGAALGCNWVNWNHYLNYQPKTYSMFNTTNFQFWTTSI